MHHENLSKYPEYDQKSISCDGTLTNEIDVQIEKKILNTFSRKYTLDPIWYENKTKMTLTLVITKRHININHLSDSGTSNVQQISGRHFVNDIFKGVFNSNICILFKFT